ncbi:MAG: hypothetical protein Q8S73_36710 [Deltaproteobacteria bacterium]|nr:hypothetical protein [Myxococcales bacterium]MDP3219701.1 hypothetical protein [Deltaproteobacteria bacterium]
MSAVLNMMAMGSFLAERMRAGDAAALLDQIAPLAPAGASEGEVFAKNSVRRTRVWAMDWHNSGFPRVHLGHRHAAALMATSTRAESIPDARPPWNAFLLDVPDGLIEWPLAETTTWEGGPPLKRSIPQPIALVSVIVEADGRIEFYPTTAGGQIVGMGAAASVAGLGDFKHGIPACSLLGRLVLGVCMEMTSTGYKGGALGPRPVKRDGRTGEPKTWTFHLTRDVKVDCRATVRDYCTGATRSAPAVQCLVRGHWKQQPCGKGGADRRNIFVEPYWRGPEDADIALRSHRVRAERASP